MLGRGLNPRNGFAVSQVLRVVTTTSTNVPQNRFKVPVNTSRVHTNMDRASILFYLSKQKTPGQRLGVFCFAREVWTCPLSLRIAQTIGFDRPASLGVYPGLSSVKTGVQVPQNWEIGFCLSPNFYARSEDVEPEKTAQRSFHRVLRCRKLTTGTNSAQNRFKVPQNWEIGIRLPSLFRTRSWTEPPKRLCRFTGFACSNYDEYKCAAKPVQSPR